MWKCLSTSSLPSRQCSLHLQCICSTTELTRTPSFLNACCLSGELTLSAVQFVGLMTGGVCLPLKSSTLSSFNILNVFCPLLILMPFFPLIPRATTGIPPPAPLACLFQMLSYGAFRIGFLYQRFLTPTCSHLLLSLCWFVQFSLWLWRRLCVLWLLLIVTTVTWGFLPPVCDSLSFPHLCGTVLMWSKPISSVFLSWTALLVLWLILLT